MPCFLGENAISSETTQQNECFHICWPYWRKEIPFWSPSNSYLCQKESVQRPRSCLLKLCSKSSMDKSWPYYSLVLIKLSILQIMPVTYFYVSLFNVLLGPVGYIEWCQIITLNQSPIALPSVLNLWCLQTQYIIQGCLTAQDITASVSKGKYQRVCFGVIANYVQYGQFLDSVINWNCVDGYCVKQGS